PNFVYPDPGVSNGKGQYALFAGRLSPEKGVPTLLEAWQRLGGRVPLEIAGDGPVRAAMEAAARGLGQVRFLGRLAHERTIAAMRKARFVVFPGECYENFPVTIAEAFACGVPVIASRLGAMAEIVDDKRTGLHFTPGDAADLAAKAEWAWTHPEEMREMGAEARREYERKYTAERNYERLMQIYEAVRS